MAKTNLSAGVQDAFRGFADREVRDNTGTSPAEKQRKALNEALSKSLPWGHDYDYNTKTPDQTLGVHRDSHRGNHSTLHEMMANMSEAFMDDDMEKQLYFEEFMPNATQAYQRTHPQGGPRRAWGELWRKIHKKEALMMTDILQELYSEHPKTPEQLALQAAEQAFFKAFGYMPRYSPGSSFVTGDIVRAAQ